MEEIKILSVIIVSILIFWKVTEYILDTKKIIKFIPFFIFAVVGIFVSIVIRNEIYNNMFWMIIQIVTIVNMLFILLVIYYEVKK